MGFHSQSDHTSRKLRRCENCLQLIQVGDRYRRETGVWEGDFYSVASHIECSEDLEKHVQENGIEEPFALIVEIDESGDPMESFDLQPVTHDRLAATYRQREAAYRDRMRARDPARACRKTIA